MSQTRKVFSKSLKPESEAGRSQGQRGRRKAICLPGQRPAGSALCYGGTAWAVGGCWVFRVVGTKECTCPLLQTVFSPTEKSRQISQNPKMGVCVTLEGSMALCGGLTVHTGLLPGASSHSPPPPPRSHPASSGQEAQWAYGLREITEPGGLVVESTWVLGSSSYITAGVGVGDGGRGWRVAHCPQAALEFLAFLLSPSSPPSIFSKVSCPDARIF